MKYIVSLVSFTLPVFSAVEKKFKGYRKLKKLRLADLYKKHKWAG